MITNSLVVFFQLLCNKNCGSQRLTPLSQNLSKPRTIHADLRVSKRTNKHSALWKVLQVLVSAVENGRLGVASLLLLCAQKGCACRHTEALWSWQKRKMWLRRAIRANNLRESTCGIHPRVQANQQLTTLNMGAAQLCIRRFKRSQLTQSMHKTICISIQTPTSAFSVCCAHLTSWSWVLGAATFVQVPGTFIHAALEHCQSQDWRIHHRYQFATQNLSVKEKWLGWEESGHVFVGFVGFLHHFGHSFYYFYWFSTCQSHGLGRHWHGILVHVGIAWGAGRHSVLIGLHPKN